jgi:hypothetical protein
MEPKCLDEKCDVFMNMNEIKMEKKHKVKGFKKFQVLNLKMMIQYN